MKVETQCSQNEELKFPGTLRNHNVFNFINVHKYIGLKPMKHYDFKRHYVSALSKGGFSIHINPVIMIARCQCFTSIVCQMNENASTLLQLWRSTMRAKRRTEQEQYEIISKRTIARTQTNKRSFFHDLLFVFLISFGNFSDHGSKSSKNERSVSSICFGISVSKCSKYSYGFRSFALVVS